ncbi:MAG: peptidyl-prolyl cis-trans isomerase [Vicinamibacteria bacterium]
MGEGRRIRDFAREPLLHFAAAGAILFLASALFAPSDSNRIVVTKEVAQALATEREELLLRPLSSEERDRLVSDFIDEEVLLHEAYRQGLDRGDPRIRRWLIDKVAFLIDEEPKEPAPADLDALFREKPEHYLTPRAVSFDHVFYASGDGEPILSALRAGADFTRLGDEFWLGRTLNRFSELELSTTLGADFATRVLALPVGEWVGPIPSSRGVHFVRVTAKHDPELPPRDDVAWALREDWLRTKREESRARKLGELRARYRIEIQAH